MLVRARIFEVQEGTGWRNSAFYTRFSLGGAAYDAIHGHLTGVVLDALAQRLITCLRYLLKRLVGRLAEALRAVPAAGVDLQGFVSRRQLDCIAADSATFPVTLRLQWLKIAVPSRRLDAMSLSV